MLIDREHNRLPQRIRHRLPGVEVVTFDARKDTDDLCLVMAASGPFDLIVEDSRGPGRVDRVRTAFFLVRRGGFIVVRRRPKVAPGAGNKRRARRIAREQAEALSALVRTVAGRSLAQALPRVPKPDDDTERLADAVSSMEFVAGHLTLRSGVDAKVKVRESEATHLLEVVDPAVGSVVSERPGGEVRRHGYVRQYPVLHPSVETDRYLAPALQLREYVDVVCSRGQVVTSGRWILPDTYRHNYRKRLANRHMRELAPRFAAIEGPLEPTYLPGPYFHIDGEIQGHFGHMMTEQVSRLWAWEEAKRREPGLKALLLRRGTNELRPYEVELLSGAGIDAEDILFSHRPVRVERLLCATPMFSQPAYLHPEITELWDQMADRLTLSVDQRDRPSRVFCSRKIGKRNCHNAAEVEQLFADHGFAIIYPEDHSIGEQVAIFRHLEVVAGFAGSAMFNLVWPSTPKRVILISSESYTAKNEYLIAAARGHDVDVTWSQPDVPRGERSTSRSFQSDFTFAMAGRVRTYVGYSPTSEQLRRLLRRGDRPGPELQRDVLRHGGRLREEDVPLAPPSAGDPGSPEVEVEAIRFGDAHQRLWGVVRRVVRV